MTNDPSTNGHGPEGGESKNGSTNFTVKAGLAKMLKGGVIMDVVDADQVLFSDTLVTPLGKLLTTLRQE